MDTQLWMVTQDGRPLQCGLSRAEAERQAAYLAHGYESHKASDKRRAAEFEVKRDTRTAREFDANYQWYKENS